MGFSPIFSEDREDYFMIHNVETEKRKSHEALSNNLKFSMPEALNSNNHGDAHG